MITQLSTILSASYLDVILEDSSSTLRHDSTSKLSNRSDTAFACSLAALLRLRLVG